MGEFEAVTVSVITYNSSKFIVETLESIKAQSYSNLELIVSDDYSTDDTIPIVREWINNNTSRFLRTQVLTVQKNTGVSANLNRAWDACETEWVKLIAGDDLLLPNCIEDFMNYAKSLPTTEVIFSRVRPFSIHKGHKRWDNESWHDYNFFKLSPEEQYHYLFYKGNKLPAASCFYNIKRLRELNIRCNERIPLLEDYPLWLVFTRKGIRFNFLDKHTVGYRMHNDSLSVGLFSPIFYKSNILLYLYYYLDEIKKDHDRDVIFNLISDQLTRFYSKTYNRVVELETSKEYKLGYWILYPWNVAVFLFSKIKSIFYHN